MSFRMSRRNRTSQSRKVQEKVFFLLLKVAAVINVAVLLSMVVYIVWNGISEVSWSFLTESPRNMMTEGGIWPCIVGTFLLAFGAMCIALPFGVGCAIWLHEYAKDGVLKNIIKLAVANLAGVPSIVFGLFGLAFFVTLCGFGISVLSGVLTLAVLTLPIIINTVEETLSQVPNAWRESSYALGASKSQTIFRVVLPAALPGLLTGAILALARAAGETSAIMFTAAVISTPHLPDSVFSAVMSLPYHIYVLTTTGTAPEVAVPIQCGTAFVLLVLVLGMNLWAIIVREKIAKNLKH
ncbi:MAG: phosphate ABC transporter permease PstA [Burkholderiaceae bacterium]|nr:phosphate ABC transporter permease PstA [Burkholderiaceae bacterium]